MKQCPKTSIQELGFSSRGKITSIGLTLKGSKHLQGHQPV